MKRENGTSLLEVIVALALLGIIGVLFMGSAANSANARAAVDERASAKILAESIIDTVKKMDYDSSYEVTVPEEYEAYTANVTAAYLNDSSDIQKITVIISLGDKEILTLENYKVNR